MSQQNMSVLGSRDGNGGERATAFVEARGMRKHYSGFTLQDVSFSVEPGQVVGFIGQNGSGKSTTIKALLGLIKLDAGGATVLGAPSSELTSGTAAEVNEEIGVVFDTVSLPNYLKVRDVAKLMARAYCSWDAQVFEGYARRFELDDDKEVKELSRGMGMKLSLACALSHHPLLLVLDEATAGLDPLAREDVLDMLRDFVAVEDAAGNPQHAILMSSHITSDLEKIADEIICIDNGAIVFACPKDEITDMMGIARCRTSEVEALVESGVFGAVGSDAPRVLRHDYGVDVLVPDRFAFAQAAPDVPCDRMTIDDYMAFMLKGVVLPGVSQKGGDR